MWRRSSCSTTGASSRISALATGFCAIKVTVTRVNMFLEIGLAQTDKRARECESIAPKRRFGEGVGYSDKPGYSGLAASSSAAAVCAQSAGAATSAYLALELPAGEVVVITPTTKSAPR